MMARRRARGPARIAAILCVATAVRTLVVPAAAQEPDAPSRLLGPSVQDQANGVLGILGLSVVPNETASTLLLENRQTDGLQLRASQLGGAFTVSDEFPLYLEGFVGLARYDPDQVLALDDALLELRSKWTSLAATGGIGWDLPLTEAIALRPIANVSLGHVESDGALAGRVIEDETGVDLAFLENGRLNAVGYGGSLMLDYERYRPGYEVDVELRYTHILLESFGGSSDAVEGRAEATALALWSRLRLPTGWTAFDRPVRGVGEFAASWFPGDQADALGSDWLAQIGGGIEFDTAAVAWLPIDRSRLMLRLVVGDGVQGVSTGIGLTF